MSPDCYPQAGRGYSNSWAHVDDELGRLDLRIRIAVLRRQGEERAHSSYSELQSGAVPDSVAYFPAQGSDAVMEKALLDALVARGRDIEQKRRASQAAGTHLALPRLADIFRLSTFEEQCLLTCFAIEIDARYEKHYAFLQNDVARKHPSAALLLDLLCPNQGERQAARRAFSVQSPLFEYRLLQVADARGDAVSPSLSRALYIDQRIANYLLGITSIDDRLLPVARLITNDPRLASLPVSLAKLADRMKAFVRHHLASSEAPKGLAFHLYGADVAAQRAAVESICRDLALLVVFVDIEKAMAAGPTSSELPWLIGREAVLLPAAICIESTDSWLDDAKSFAQREAWFTAIRGFSQLTFLLGRSLWSPGKLSEGLIYIEIAFPTPAVEVRRALWEDHLAARQVHATIDPGVLASRFRFNAEQIRNALDAAETIAYWRDPARQTVTAEDISEACRAQVSLKVSGLAVKTAPVHKWDNLVLPPDHLRLLRELCNQARHRHIVYGDWGFERRLSLGKGLNALFTGPPGTGKTMAAEVIGAELQVDMYKIDLSQAVSKYIGETEKNLDQMFREAESGNAILFFDEADALFGKRSEVKDAHDRYANIETGYLLQRMEQHEGIVILATNLRNNLDEAFCRRMHFVVEFPFPDEEHRTRLWEGLFPADVPRDEEIDFRFLAKQFKVPGGNIRNIGLCAAFLAAAEGTGLTMPHLIMATRREYKKLGWPCTANDFGAYHDLIKALDG
jgi:SpoVK/Ycf46/Vps4 family AAA+-type ATPase